MTTYSITKTDQTVIRKQILSLRKLESTRAIPKNRLHNIADRLEHIINKAERRSAKQTEN